MVLSAKLPGWFKVPLRAATTPTGPCRSTRAVRLLYFARSLFTDDMRNEVRAEIECGKTHFRALTAGEKPALYLVATSFSDVQKSLAKLSFRLRRPTLAQCVRLLNR